MTAFVIILSVAVVALSIYVVVLRARLRLERMITDHATTQLMRSSTFLHMARQQLIQHQAQRACRVDTSAMGVNQ